MTRSAMSFAKILLAFALILQITASLEGCPCCSSEKNDSRHRLWRGGASISTASRRNNRWERLDDQASKPAPRACSFYWWDAPSALLYKWCHHLMKDCVYEGRGGHKFVRISPGSFLQLLYPCSRYSPDRCIFCGGSFPDHLQLWWAKNLYTPYDRWLDRTTILGVESEDGSEESYSFHERYVLDVNSFLSKHPKRRKAPKIIKNLVNGGGVEVRTPFLLSMGPKYLVPKLPQNPTWKGFCQTISRTIVLNRLDSLLLSQHLEHFDQKKGDGGS